MTLTNQAAFEEELLTLMKAFRDGDLLAINNSSLAQTGLFTDIFFLDEAPTPASRYELVEAVLRWGIDHLKPAGTPDPFANQWRHYNVLHGFYLENLRVAELAEKMGIAEQTFYEWRNTAAAGMGQFLFSEHQEPQDLFGRRQHFLHKRLSQLSEGELAILTLVALAEHDLLWRRFFPPRERELLPKLANLYLLHYDPAEAAVSQPDALKRHLRLLIPADYQEESHAVLYQRLRRGGLIRSAVRHAHKAGLTSEAIQLAVSEAEALFQQVNGDGLSQLLGEIAAGQAADYGVSTNMWAQFMAIAAKAAQWEDNLELALQYSREALTATDLEIKLKGYHQRAKLLSRVNIDECLSHYAVGFDLFHRLTEQERQEQAAALNPLVTRMYIDRAWIFIQDRPDYAQAAQDLDAAEALISPAASDLWSDLYNGRAELVARTESAEAALPFHLKALTAAEASGDIERMSKMAYMVGLDHMFSEAYTQAQQYFDQSLTWAEQSGNVQTQAVAHKGLGGCYYFLEDYQKAIDHYLIAYRLWHKSHNLNWLANICYDLAEGYATIHQFDEARRYYEEGIALAQQLDLQRFYEEFVALKNQYPSLEFVLGERQAQTLAFVDKEGGINRQQYMGLTGVSKSQAYRDLNEMCEQGLLRREGVGRGTHYVRAA